MRFVDVAIDLAAVLRASRSVASKHIALRSRQLDRYTRSSSAAQALRNKAVGGFQQSLQQEGQDETRDASGVTIDGGVRQDADTKTQDWQADATPTDASSEPSAYAQASKRAAEIRDTQQAVNTPNGVDVNIFHTNRGSQVLDSLRKQGAAGPRMNRPSKPSEGPPKEHPLRYWKPAPPLEEHLEPEESTTAASANASPTPAPAHAKETESQPIVQPIESVTKDADANKSTHPDVDPVVQLKAKNADEEIIDLAKDLTGASSAATPSYQLRESKVPSSRLSRMWNYGGLATGMLGGAITESVSRAFGGGGSGSVLLSGNNMERLVAKLSRMRGAALKLGQIMSFQDSKMLPAPLQEVLQRVQDRADYMPAWQRDKVLTANLGADWRELFSEFDEKPMAAASIGQVHKGVLKKNGKKVAVKIQFPGVADSINSDLDNLGILLNATTLLPKGLYLNKTIDNARVELGWECDYEREAACAQRYKKLLSNDDDVFLVPDVYPEASGKQVLTMDFMEGVTVTRVKTFTQQQRDWIGSSIMRLCLREITEFKFMQTDPNWTNFLYNADLDRLVLLDFGASREYPEEFVAEYVQLLAAAARSDKATVKALSESLGYLTGHESKAMLDAHTQSILTLAEPFLDTAPEVYDFQDQTITERVKALIPVMLRERLAPPPEETYSLHRKLSGAFLLCSRMGSKVPAREMFANAVAKSGYVKN
ncbi:uncharacterized protein J7T54_002027 [Emericellopsis cladophorae]|uniref:ABC1 atypical kinase-like domain-containing protein n=1 Tax=Emericellopsis cladophorae TaxID=2686198 RepID=A0A9P9Y467_9HYPO|nr:uncharacterized protein J7T54_002027 [Emericellopsis cladophorae]KAI6782868.1 hypothetical protein J7T54_002027 [Emericellopsis cladophorae]